MHFLKIAANVPKMTWDINVQNSLELNDKTMFSFFMQFEKLFNFPSITKPYYCAPTISLDVIHDNKVGICLCIDGICLPNKHFFPSIFPVDGECLSIKHFE